ncbi:ABC transporter substrate-binding protein [Paractinoplanes brasiliensis]|uniref:NitT/TauT family transport system substrate-binding protein n=1 Tax=Paractinoplanes brasiliensis TaxID=52695 RepID=A0A4R6JL44_9ACTN|nr:ABC transporter substrate-binding protein [Actinoplanes brasiliensis]TDO36487.1 NitT/TauT family transport system substrate-binding protein [Actinoplanes brasiliensis]GID32542.1 hypothetical protein Abr02nite_75250 [Actinoplanes brasiliensis]
MRARGVRLLVLTLLVAIGACGSPASATVAYGGIRDQSAAAFVAADLGGFTAEAGLTWSPTWATSGTVILQGLVSGDFDVATLGPAQLYGALRNGACARVLRPTQGAAYGVVARPGLRLDTTRPYPGVLTQLRGKTVGVPARGAAQELVLRSLLTDAGLNPDTDVTWVAIGAGPAAVTAFTSGQVDAAMSYPQLEMNLRAGFDKLVDLAGPESPLGAFWQSVAVANCDWADKNHETVLKLCHALNQGFQELARNPDAGPRAFVHLGLAPDLDQARTVWQKHRYPVVTVPPLTEENWDHQAKFAAGATAPDFSEHVVDGCATA